MDANDTVSRADGLWPRDLRTALRTESEGVVTAMVPLARQVMTVDPERSTNL